ncbi:MAG: hypothetical protein LBJ31_07835 [Treponema sp.]|jgi:hypothetical protein|nr:hypothetical protein [Treponema sp.]
MADVRRFIFILSLAAAVCASLAARGKGEAPAEGPGEGSYVALADGDLQVYQIITFPAVPYTRRYEVEIEQLREQAFVPVEKTDVETNRIQLNLRAGSYRYRITAYNRAGLQEGMSDWQEFEVSPAIPPRPETYQPFYGLYYEMAETSGQLTVAGQDFLPQSEFALVPHKDIDWSGADLEKRGDVLLPDRVTVTRSAGNQAQAVLDFSRQRLKRGEYDIFIRNPGGLWSVLGRVRVGYRKNTDWTFALGWSPVMALFDTGGSSYTHNGTEQGESIDFFNLQGAYLRLGWIPVKTRRGNFGLELNAGFLMDKEWKAEHDANGFDYFGAFQNAHLDLLYQAPSIGKLQAQIRFGAGAGDYYDETWDEGNGVPVLLNFGVSGQYFVWENFYYELGVDFQFMTRVNHFSIRPVVGLGWQFGRWGEMAVVKKAQDRGEDPSVPVSDIPAKEFTLSLGWSPMIPLGMDRTKSDEHDGRERTMLSQVNPQGFYLRMAFLPHRWGKNRLGPELQTYMLNYPGRAHDGDGVYAYINIFSHHHIGVLYQRIMTDDWRLNARFGAGISHPYDYDGDDEDIPPSLHTGLSFQRFFSKGLYAEAGLDVFVSFGRETHWMINPGIGIGWQFNRTASTGLKDSVE